MNRLNRRPATGRLRELAPAAVPTAAPDGVSASGTGPPVLARTRSTAQSTAARRAPAPGVVAQPTARAVARLSLFGIRVVPNDERTGLQSLIAALRQAQGADPDSLTADVASVRASLSTRDDALGFLLRDGQEPGVTGPTVMAVVEEMFHAGGQPALLVLRPQPSGAVQAFAPLAAAAGGILDARTVPHDALVLLQHEGRFEALANTAGVPWSTLVPSMSLPPPATPPHLDAGLQTAWQVVVRAVNAAGVPGTFECRRGTQVDLLPMQSPVEELAHSALALASRMAEGQSAVDEFWLGVEQGGAVHLGEASDGVGQSLHRLSVSPPQPGGTGGLPPAAAPSTAVLHLRRGWLAGMTLVRPDGTEIAVDYRHPWRPSVRVERTQGLMDARLASALRTIPREAGEGRIAFAIRLHRRHPELDHRALARGSGLELADIRQNPVLNPQALNPEQRGLLEAATRGFPRPERMAPMSYARELARRYPELSAGALSQGSGLPEGRIASALRPRASRDAPPTAPAAAVGELSREQEAARVPPVYMSAALRLTEALRHRLERMDLAVLPNEGAGRMLCLVVSMLQADGVSGRQLDRRSAEILERLVARQDAVGEAARAAQGFHADRAVFQAIADEVFDLGAPTPPMLVMQAHEHATVQLFAPLAEVDEAVEPANVPVRAVVILESPGHFEAIVNTAGRPWSDVLSELRRPENEALPAPGDRQEARPLEVRSVSAEGRHALHRWQRSPQTGLAPLRPGLGDADRGPQALAQAMAAGQEAVDDFWAGLSRSEGFELGTQPASGGGRIHLMGVSPPDDYYQALPRDASRNLSLPPVAEGVHQYVGRMHVHEERLIGLTVETTGEGDVAVDYQSPHRQEAGFDRLPSLERVRLNAALRVVPPDADTSVGHLQRRALALQAVEPALGLDALALGSGASRSDLGNYPAIMWWRVTAEQREAATALRASLPRRPGATNIAYARYLIGERPEVSIGVISLASLAREKDIVQWRRDVESRADLD